MGIAIIVGVPGVGKTTVLNGAVKRLSEKYSIKLVNYGDVMLDIARSEGLVNNRDEMRLLSIEDQLRLQRDAAAKISREAEEADLLILDTHLFIKTPRGRWPGLSENNLPYLKGVKQLILVEADPKDIVSRRERDKSRRRSDYGGAEEVAEDQKYNRLMAANISIRYGCPVYILRNEEGDVETAIEELYKLLSSVISEG